MVESCADFLMAGVCIVSGNIIPDSYSPPFGDAGSTVHWPAVRSAKASPTVIVIRSRWGRSKIKNMSILSS